jgi:hypothetical protein
VSWSPASPDPKDQGKFVIEGKPARAIHYFSGWNVKINLDWFSGSHEPPIIKGSEFYWYAFAIPDSGNFKLPHYFVCDYEKMRSWVLEFRAPLGNDHRDHPYWRCDIRPRLGSYQESKAYFRWGDEAIIRQSLTTRFMDLDNIQSLTSAVRDRNVVAEAQVSNPEITSDNIKFLIGKNPKLIGLSADYSHHIDYKFRTGDIADIYFIGPSNSYAIAEIAISGEENIMTGIHNLLKKYLLASLENELITSNRRIRKIFITIDSDLEPFTEVAHAYNVDLVRIHKSQISQLLRFDPEKILRM